MNTEMQKNGMSKPFLDVKKISYIGIFIALSAVGSFIKIPSPVGSVGLDSAPGFFAALTLGYGPGALIIALGHLLTSGVVGFPLTVPMHLVIAGLMALWAVAFRWVNARFGLLPAMIAAIFLNGVVSSVTVVPAGGVGGAIALMPFLVIGSAINIIIAGAAYKTINRKSGSN